VTPLEWQVHAPLIARINQLKREKNAVILAHNYMTPEIFHGVGDYVGDSLGLAKEAARSEAKVIVQAGVHFMAETSKILCPDKTVLIPDLRAGCSLALDHRRRRAADQAALPGPAGGHLCEHHGRCEGRDRHLLHQRQRRAGGGVGREGMGRRPRHPDP
jgi:quinolinate synthase